MPDRQTARSLASSRTPSKIFGSAGALNGDAASFSKSASLMVRLDTGARNFAILRGRVRYTIAFPASNLIWTAGLVLRRRAFVARSDNNLADLNKTQASSSVA